MIVLDPRIGSGELLSYFKPYDVEVKVKQLYCGDCMWWGSGPSGPERIGVERKGLSDLVSSMRSNRLSGFQLPKLLAFYNWTYLLIEGVYRCGEGEVVEIRSGGRSRMGRGSGSNWTALRINGKPILYREVDHYLATLQHRCGLNVCWAKDKEQTVAWIVSRYKWWEKEWGKHDAHEAIYAPYDHIIPARRGSLTLKEVGPIEMVAAQLPGVAKKAYEFRKVFKSARMVANADVGQLQRVEGIGKKGALDIFNWWRRGE